MATFTYDIVTVLSEIGLKMDTMAEGMVKNEVIVERTTTDMNRLATDLLALSNTVTMLQ